IRERWDELRPVLTLHARRYAINPMQQIEEWRVVHEVRVGEMLKRGIRLRSIRRHSWDDPRHDDAAFMEMIVAALNNQSNRKRAAHPPPKGLAKFKHSAVPSTTTRGDKQ